MQQEEYNIIQNTITDFKKSKTLNNEMIKMIEKLDKLMDNEYRYGSSHKDLVKINEYLIKCKNNI